MKLYPEKCNVLHKMQKKMKLIFHDTLHNHVLEEVPSAKYLGVTISTTE